MRSNVGEFEKKKGRNVPFPFKVTTPCVNAECSLIFCFVTLPTVGHGRVNILIKKIMILKQSI